MAMQRNGSFDLSSEGLAAFVLMAKNGTPRVVLELTAAGVPGVKLTDTEGNTRASLTMLDSSLALLFMGKNAKYRTSILASPQLAGLSIHDEDGEIKAAINVMNSKGNIGISDKDGEILWEAQ